MEVHGPVCHPASNNTSPRGVVTIKATLGVALVDSNNLSQLKISNLASINHRMTMAARLDHTGNQQSRLRTYRYLALTPPQNCPILLLKMATEMLELQHLSIKRVQ